MVARARSALSALAALSFFALAACEAPVEEESASNAAIVGGQSDLRHPAIGYILNMFEKPDGTVSVSSVVCTGSLIASDVVLTAAHCLTKAEERAKAAETKYGITYTGLGFGVGEYDDANITRVRSSTAHPDYAKPSTDARDNAVSVSYEHDLAYLVLKKPITGIKPLTVRRSSHKGSCDYVATGYGATTQERDADGKLSESGQGTRKALEVCADQGYTARMITSYSKTGSVCHGDSGGPLRVRDSREFVGVVSYSYGEDCTADLVNYYAPLATNLDFIDEALSSGE
jgi:secreted trypsin-like serine protease